MLLGFLLLYPTVSHADNHSVINKEMRVELCKEVVHFYRNEARLNYNRFRPYMFAAYHVNQMVPNYPAKNETDRMLRFFQFGGLESSWGREAIVLNVPGASYSNGKVKRVSVDFSPFGINEDQVSWTYAVAKAIQDGRRIPKQVGNWKPNAEFIEMAKHMNVPQDLDLKKIDLNLVKLAKQEYYREKKYIKDPNKLRISVNKHMPEFTCDTQDDLDSTLLYRVLEDMDRVSRGWKHGLELYSPSKYELYEHLSEFAGDNYEEEKD